MSETYKQLILDSISKSVTTTLHQLYNYHVTDSDCDDTEEADFHHSLMQFIVDIERANTRFVKSM